MVATGHHALPHQHLQPARFSKNVFLHADEAPIAAEQRHAVRQLRGYFHVAAISPEGRVIALAGFVMQDQKVADQAVLEFGLAVVFVAIGVAPVGTGKKVQQPRDRGLNQVDAGRFQRLQKPTGQAHRHHVLVPGFLAPAGGEFQQPRLGQRRAVQARHQHAGGFVLAHVAAAEDMPVTGAVLQRYAPLPACGVRGGPGVGRQRASARPDPFAGHGPRAVAGQPVAPVVKAGVQGLLDEQRAKARAVDEQITRHALTALHHHASHEAVAAVLFNTDDPAFGAAHAACFGEAPKVLRIQARVEVKGVGDGRQRRVRRVHRARELAMPRRHGVHRVRTQFLGLPGREQPVPVVVERHQPQVLPDGTKRVDVAVALATPVHELDAQLEAGHGAAHEVVFVDAQRLVELLDGGDGGLAHADGGNLVGLNQVDVVAAVQHLGERRRGHPPGGAAAHDNDALQSWLIHSRLPGVIG